MLVFLRHVETKLENSINKKTSKGNLDEVEVGKGKEANEQPSTPCSTEEKVNTFVEAVQVSFKKRIKKEKLRGEEQKKNSVNGG